MNAQHSEDDVLADIADAVFLLHREIKLQTAGAPGVVHLRPSEGMIMRLVDHNAGLTVTELAELSGLQRTNVSSALTCLENKGLVEKRPDPLDGREVRVHATPLAHENIRSLRQQWASLLRTALGSASGGADALSFLSRLAGGLVEARLDDRHPLAGGLLLQGPPQS